MLKNTVGTTGPSFPVVVVLIAGLLVLPSQVMVLPAVDAATTVRYYNAAANDFLGDTTAAEVESFCSSKGGQSLCQYSVVCPGGTGTGGTILGQPGCGESPCIDGDQYFHVDPSECPSSSAFAFTGWQGSDECNLNEYCYTAAQAPFASITQTKSQIVACCESDMNGQNTWSKVDDTGTQIGSCGGDTGTQIGSCGGDPHFVRWGGKHFNYHGECDLVLMHAPNYRGKPLTVHVRTRLQGFYSIVESVAIQRGEDSVFEFNHETVNEPKYFFGGREASLPHAEGAFSVTTHMLKNVNFDADVLAVTILLDGTRDKITIHQMHQWVFVDVDATGAELAGVVGLLGTFPEGTMLGRDGVTDLNDDRNAYGSQWQVRADEPQLFHSAPEGHPMAPHAACRMPETDAHEFLRSENADFYKIAVEACTKEGMTGLDLDDCVFDVVMLRNPSMAAAWWGAKEGEVATKEAVTVEEE